MSDQKKSNFLDPVAIFKGNDPNKSVFPIRGSLFSDKHPGGVDFLIVKIAASGFLAWTKVPMYRSDNCSIKVELPLINETVTTKALVFKTYDNYVVVTGKTPQFDFNHLAEFVFLKLNDDGVRQFNRLNKQIDPKTGVPYDNPDGSSSAPQTDVEDEGEKQ